MVHGSAHNRTRGNNLDFNLLGVFQVTILETLNTPPTTETALRVIALIVIAGTMPIWIFIYRRDYDRVQLIDIINTITTASLITAFVVHPLQLFFGFDSIYQWFGFLALSACIHIYTTGDQATVNKILQDDEAIEFPEFERVEVAL